MIVQRNEIDNELWNCIDQMAPLVRLHQLAKRSHVCYSEINPLSQVKIRKIQQLFITHKQQSHLISELSKHFEFDPMILSDEKLALRINRVIRVKSELYNMIYSTYNEQKIITYNQRMKMLNYIVSRIKGEWWAPADRKELDLLVNYIPYPNQEALNKLFAISYEFENRELRIQSVKPNLQQIRSFIEMFNKDKKANSKNINRKNLKIVQDFIDYHTPFL
jgi:hypothetical protein